MDFISLRFNVFVLAAVMVFYLCPDRYRVRIAMPLLDVIFISSFVTNIAQLLPMAAFLLLGFLCIKVIERSPSRQSVILSIAAILAAFIYLKKYAFFAFVPGITWPYLAVGLSYIVFRVLHVLVDTYGGALKERMSLVTYFNYNCLFLSFISGPIQRFQEYREQERYIGKKEMSRGEVFNSFSRIINGYFKIAVFSTIFLSVHNECSVRLNSADYEFNVLNMLIMYSGACLTYTLYFYYNFAGYMDAVIGIGRFFGFELPENFNRPFTSEGFLEFWSRWHITLSDWFKTYIFNPLVKVFTYEWSYPKLIPYYGALAYFITFFLMGVWHGSSFSFLVYGLFLGLGVSVNKFYEVQMRKMLGKVSFNRLSENKIHRLIGAGLTYSYFSIALTCLWTDFDKLTWLFNKMGFFGFLVVFAAAGLFSSIVMLSVSMLKHLWDKSVKGISFLSRDFYFRQGYLSFKVFLLIAIVVSKFFAIPEFVYKAF